MSGPLLPTTEQWLDAFFSTMEVAAQTLADKKKVETQFGNQIDPSTSFSVEAYRDRVRIWKRVRKLLASFDIEELEFEGASMGAFGVQRNDRGDFEVRDPAGIRLFREGESADMCIKHPEAQCVANFISFYLTSYSQGVDPRQYVRSVLAQSGITKENFHEFEDRLAINNPWE